MFEWIDLAGTGSALAYLVEVTAKSIIVLGLAGVVVFLYRRSSAADRHRIWLAALCGVVLFPVLSALLPSWRVIQNPEWLTMLRTADLELSVPALATDIPPIPAFSTREAPASSGVAQGMAAPDRLNMDRSVNTAPATQPSTALAFSPSDGTRLQSETDAVPESRVEKLISDSGPIVSTLAAFVRGVQDMHWTTALFWIWLIGAVLVFSQLVIGAAGILVVSRRAHAVTDPVWRELVDEIGDRLFLTREVLLLKSRNTTMPMTWGGLKPVVLLPADADTWSEERKRCVLTHEFAHIKRWDCATQGVAQLACAIYWFNPLVWMAARKLRIEREKACDDYVISAGAQASNYAGHLLDIARSLKSSFLPPLGAVSMARPSQLEGRVLSILDPTPRRHRFSATARIVVSVMALGIIIPLAAMAPSEINQLDQDVAIAIEKVEQLRLGNYPVKNGRSDAETTDTETGSRSRILSAGRSMRAVADTTDDEKRRMRLIKAFIKALDDEDVEIRENAAHILGNLEGSEALEALGAVLHSDPVASVREQAAWAIGQIEDQSAVPALVEALDDTDASVRRQVIWALGQIESDSASEALIRQLKRETDSEAKETLVWAIGQMEDEAAIDVLEDTYRSSENPEIRHKAIWALTQIESPASLATFMDAAADDDEEVRAMALWALSELEDPAALPVFRAALSESSADLRRRAVFGLAQLDDAASVDVLIEAAGDEDAEVRRTAVWALGELEDTRALGVLIEAVDDSDTEVQRTAVYALGELQDDRSVDALVSALQSNSSEVRRSAAWSLGEIESARAVPALMDAVKDRDAEVRRTAVWALSEIQDQRSIPALISATEDTDSEVRSVAIHALSDFESPEIETIMIALLSDQSEDVRIMAVITLSDYESEAVENAMIRALQSDSSSEVRSSAAYVLGEIGSDRCIEALEGALEDADADVRKAVMRALGSVDLSDAGNGRSRIRIGRTYDGLSDAAVDIGKTVSQVTISAVSTVSDEILSTDLSTVVSEAAGAALTSVDWNGVAETIQESLTDMDMEIEESVVTSLIGMASDQPSTRAGKNAIRALRRSNHPRARSFTKSLDR